MNDKEIWTVYYHRDLEKEIRRLPKPHIRHILEAIETLAVNPKPGSSKKIKGHDLWRIRVGVYRICYSSDKNGQGLHLERE